MMEAIKTLVDRPTTKITWFALLFSLIAGIPAIAQEGHSMHDHPVPAKLVQDVRTATQQFLNVNAATAAGYGPFLGCVTGPDHGAMGIHYVNGGYVGDGLLDITHPEALIYEPTDGKLKLVGVEYIVDAATWLANHDGVSPALDGQVFQLVGIPNRFNIPAPFFELHVWAWRNNPNGAFVDWNNAVTCEGQ